MMKCGAHRCQLRCHRVSDHSRTECTNLVEKTCERQHKIRVSCNKKNDGCNRCLQEDKEQERRVKRNLDLEAQRLSRQDAYSKDLQEIQDEIEHHRRLIKYMTEEEEQKKTLAQQRADVEGLRETAMRMHQMKDAKDSAASTKAENHSGAKHVEEENRPAADLDLLGSAREEWEYLKQYEGAKSEPLDELMRMIGLEDVKQEFVNIKQKVDTTVRQNASLASERFSCAMLGNPGTG